MRGKTRQKISSQMKGKVALEALKGTKTANDLAQEYGGTSNASWAVEKRACGTSQQFV
jgi:hypothetical protein